MSEDEGYEAAEAVERTEVAYEQKIDALVAALKAAVSQLPDRCEHEREMARIAIEKADR